MIDSCYVGDVRDGLRAFAAAGMRAQMCVTSPPYWGLRDYGMSSQIGLEPTFDQFVQTMVDVFRLVRDVLADDGTLWVNMGDAYNAGTSANRKAPTTKVDVGGWRDAEIDGGARVNAAGLKKKDLLGQPWRVAFALQADGWYLRSDIIWHKPNPMPESVTDRPTKAHEYLFLFAKSERYYYDAEAIKEPVTGGAHRRTIKTPDGWDTTKGEGGHGSFHKAGREKGITRQAGVSPKSAEPGLGIKANASFHAVVNDVVAARNRRSVWTIPTEAFPDAHFATFPTALVGPCILAGSRVGDVVLDPFLGSGTVAQVAQSLGRRWIGCELNPAYVAMLAKRTAQHGLGLTA